MVKKYFLSNSAILTLLVLTFSGSFKTTAQTILEWDPEYQLTLNDFQSPQTEIDISLNTSSFTSGANIQFAYLMTSGEYMFTKNFNKKVVTVFNKPVANISASDSTIATQMVKFGQYQFDLAELYSRKIRKKIYEEKGAFSNPSFLQNIYDNLMMEFMAESNRMLKLTEIGLHAKTLAQEHQAVLTEIEELSDFCKSCKPKKKKKS